VKFTTIIAASFALAASLTSAKAADISGAGATFPYPLYAKWADTYKKQTGIGLNYQSIGSGGGIKQIQAKTVTFGATDAPLSGADLEKWGLIQFPMVMGGIVPVVNIDGINPAQMVLDGPTLANIYLGKITKWDDAALKALNPSLKLPSSAIIVIRRSDGSGTTFNFAHYLAKVSEDWKKNVGVSTALEWPVGIGAKGNEGVANNVMQANGSIGYVEFAYAKQNGLAYTKMVNASGKTVAPSLAAFQAGAVSADWNSEPGFAVILSNPAGATAWPMTASTWILMYREAKDAEASAAAVKFFKWAFASGDKMAMDLDYVPMPDSVVNNVSKVLAEIK
jgi:phosphate transport system substrate-binding protein